MTKRPVAVVANSEKESQREAGEQRGPSATDEPFTDRRPRSDWFITQVGTCDRP
jgi:hypothetical protein